MKSFFTVIKEQINSFYLIMRLSFYQMKSENNNHYLGVLWELLNPMIQIGVYGFVFGFGLRGKPHPPINGIDYFSWLISGFAIYYFINQAILNGSKSVYTRIRMVAKMSFPLSAIPSYVIMAKFYQHLMLFAVVLVILQFKGHYISIQFIQIPYYMFATLVFLIALSLLTSTLATIVRDVQMMLQAIVRMLLYLSPVLWVPVFEDKYAFITTLMKLNPIYYLVQGYRSALLGSSPWYFIEHGRYTLYFWVLMLVLLFIGAKVHVKFRDRFIDFL